MDKKYTLKTHYKKFEQPSGTFLFCVLTAKQIISISEAKERKFDVQTEEYIGGVERKQNQNRIGEIAEYAKTPDAMFPTPIILALEENTYDFLETDNIGLLIDHDSLKAEIIDGQHRIAGIKLAIESTKNQSVRNTLENIDLPVLLVLGLTIRERALIFSIINGKQQQVPKSVVYDLFGLYEGKCPEKFAHDVVLALNISEKSPWNRKLKMLGYKTPGSKESLSQGTFVKELLILIKKGKGVLRDYYERDDVNSIASFLARLFSGLRNCWQKEWENNSTLWTKSVGFTAVMKAIPKLISKNSSDVVKHFEIKDYQDIFSKVKDEIVRQSEKEKKDPLDFLATFQGGSGATKLAKIIEVGIDSYLLSINTQIPAGNL